MAGGEVDGALNATTDDLPGRVIPGNRPARQYYLPNFGKISIARMTFGITSAASFPTAELEGQM